MDTLPEANKNWSLEGQAAYNRIKADMEKTCKDFSIPMKMLQNSILKGFEEENVKLHNYATTQEEKKTAGIIGRWLSSIFGKN
jgi:hypothetical protein